MIVGVFLTLKLHAADNSQALCMSWLIGNYSLYHWAKLDPEDRHQGIGDDLDYYPGFAAVDTPFSFLLQRRY